MERRDFLKQTAKLTAGGLITASMLGCKSLHDFYSFDGSLRNGIIWSNFQLSVNIGSEGTYDAVGADQPSVIKDGATYKMWYIGLAGGTNRIIYAQSTDGISWSNFQLSINIGAEGTYDTASVNTPTVIKDNGTYKMWYAGNNSRIIYAESADGISWSNFQLSVNIGSEGTYDTAWAVNPTVIKDGSTYKMWYAGYDWTNWRIISAKSSDGISWSNFQLSVNIGSEGTYDTTEANAPAVIKDGSTYKMWYAGTTGVIGRIIYAESTDGISWSNFQLSINIGAQGTYDTSWASTPSVINVGGLGKMWYSGLSGGTWRIIYCESR